MRVSDHLNAAVLLGMAANKQLHEKWVSLLYKLAGTYSVALLAHAGDTRLDMMLRALESETIEKLKSPQTDVDFVFDLQMSLSENWLLSAYEVIRTSRDIARARKQPNERLNKLLARFELVRMPLAKHQIAKANWKPPGLLLAPIGEGQKEVKPYKNDGSYIMPKGVCAETGSIIWWPIDLTITKEVAISRRMLSDEFLNLFDE